MKQKTHLRILLATATACAVAGATTALADQQLSVAYSMPMKVNAQVDESGCQNSGGPSISLGGEVSLGGLGARLFFMNNAKGTHTATVEWQADVSLVPLGSTITIPKQPVRGGVGGNPYIYLQFHDGKGKNLTDEFFLGRCVQGLMVSPDLISEAAALATVKTGDCSGKGGPTVTFGGNITLGGLHANIIFRNNVKGTHTAEDTRDVTIILEGSSITIPKSPVKGGAGGNPIIAIQFLQGNGSPIADPVVLGRCNQL